MIMEQDHSHQHERDGNVQYVGLLATYRVRLHDDQALQSHTQNTTDNSDMMPEAEAILLPGKIAQKQSTAGASI
jgi:hypothetical protein